MWCGNTPKYQHTSLSRRTPITEVAFLKGCFSSTSARIVVVVVVVVVAAAAAAAFVVVAAAAAATAAAAIAGGGGVVVRGVFFSVFLKAVEAKIVMP